MKFYLGVFETHMPLAIGLISIIVAVTLLSIYLAGKRLKQNKPRFVLVTLANITFAAAIMGLAFNLQINNSSTVTSYLITTGVQTEQLKNIDSSDTIYILGEPSSTAAGALAEHTTVRLDSVSQLFDLQPNIQNLKMIGSGLTNQQWQDLEVLSGDKVKAINMTFLPPKPTLGLVDVTWQKERVEGQFIQLSGQLIGHQDQPNAIYQLSLIDPIGEVVQVARLKAKEPFSFNFAAKSVGQWVYQLQLKKANESSPIATEPVAFNVLSAPVVKVLIKQAAPTFETKQFSNWVSTFNAKITVLTSISKNKDIRQNFNFTAQEIAELNTPLSKKSLDDFDLMLIDGRSLLVLSDEQKQALEAAVKSGLGLYIMLDQSLLEAWPSPSLNWLSKLAVAPLNTASYSAIPQWQNSKIEQSIALVKAKLSASPDDILVTSHLQQPLVTNTQLGMGRVAMSLINNTYGWQTAGLTSEYSHYWQHIIYQLSRPQSQLYWVEPSEVQLQFEQQRYQACVFADLNDKTLTHWANNQQQTFLAMRKPLHSEQFCGTTWLTSSGWQQFRASSSNNLDYQHLTSSIYVYNKTDWQAFKQAQNINLSQQKIANLAEIAVNQTLMEDLPKAWFWWCLVIVSSLIWIERKTFSSSM